MDEREELDLDAEEGGEALDEQEDSKKPVLIKILQFGIGGILLLIIMVLISVVVVNVTQKSGARQIELPQAQMKQPAYFSTQLGEFNCALSPGGDGVTHFVQATISIAYDKNDMSRLGPELGTRKPQMKDIVNSLLVKKRYSDLIGEDGKDKLKREMMAAINNVLINGQIRDLYFEKYIVQ